VLGENANTQRYQGKRSTENKKQGFVRGVTLKSVKRKRVKMPKEQIKFEIFVRDFRGERMSCGKHQAEIENYTYCIHVPQDRASVSQIEIEFFGKVQD